MSVCKYGHFEDQDLPDGHECIDELMGRNRRYLVQYDGKGGKTEGERRQGTTWLVFDSVDRKVVANDMTYVGATWYAEECEEFSKVETPAQ